MDRENTWAGKWRRNPIAALGSRAAPLLDPAVGMTPYSKWLGTSRAMNARAWGVDAWPWTPLEADDTIQERQSIYANPGNDPERIQWFDAFNRIELSASDITPTWRAWEIARFVIPSNFVGSIDKMPTSIDSVIALDGDGNPLYSYGPQNGQRATVESLLHPTPGVGRLEWRFRLTLINQGPTSDTPNRLAGSAAPLGLDIVEPWKHLSNGSDVVWAARQQIVCRAAALVRYFVEFRGPALRFTLQAGARLSGYVQSAGHMKSALLDVTRRTG